jgi:hypothetical protein
MSSKTTFTILSVFIAIWAVLGFMDVGNFTSTGYSTGPDNAVTNVQDGGAAEAAGMQVGDVLQSIDGIAMDDNRARSNQPRPTIGQTRTIVVDRSGETVEVSVTHAAQSSSQKLGSYIGILTGLAFAGMGIWAFLAVGTRASFLLAASGVLFAVPFTGGPYLGTSTLGTIMGAVIFLCIVLAFAKLLHFMIVFPNGNEPDKRWVYGPALLVGLMVVVLNIAQPSGPTPIFQFVFLAWIVGYVGLALFKMVRTWSSASAEDRSAHGLNILVAGTGLGLGLLLLNVVINALAPTVTIPGQQWMALTLVLVPISCALAAVKSGRASTPAA